MAGMDRHGRHARRRMDRQARLGLGRKTRLGILRHGRNGPSGTAWRAWTGRRGWARCARFGAARHRWHGRRGLEGMDGIGSAWIGGRGWASLRQDRSGMQGSVGQARTGVARPGNTGTTWPGTIGLGRQDPAWRRSPSRERHGRHGTARPVTVAPGCVWHGWQARRGSSRLRHDRTGRQGSFSHGWRVMAWNRADRQAWIRSAR